MLTTAYLSILLVMQAAETAPETPPEAPPEERVAHDRIKLVQDKGGLALSWSDAEDTLTGSVTPLRPKAKDPLTVSVRVGTYQGAEFKGPVRLVLRAEGETHPMEQVVNQRAGDRAWVAVFTPETDGHHTLEISFNTSRNKVLVSGFEVAPGRMPLWPWYVLAFLVVAIGVGVGVRMALKKEG